MITMKKAGDEIRTRDSLLGRQMLTNSPPTYYKLALEEHSRLSDGIHAHLRHIVACFLGQMVMDQFTRKLYIFPV
jgi:hypothetical protein